MKTENLARVLQKNEKLILTDWLKEQLAAGSLRSDLMKESELREQSKQFLASLQTALQRDSGDPAWAEVRELVAGFAKSRAQQGFTPSETATFVFSLKQPLFAALRQEYPSNPQAQADEMWSATQILDRLGLHATEAYQKIREEVIGRQQRELLELSTPVVTLWENVLALPLIGTLDSARTQVVMETLLQKIVETGAEIAIIDITGVPTVDTLVAQHLMKTVAATRLMGAECIISGIRPQIAQTIVHLGVDLGEVITKATLADAFLVALKRIGAHIGPQKNGANGANGARPEPARPNGAPAAE
jgi:rsbT co-antagonist protein RsbR